MTEAHIDLETYSSFDLRKTGVYRYVEAPDFEILIIAYSVDNGEVKSIDMYNRDEELYKEFRGLLFDPQVTKLSFNANFERTALAKHFKTDMPPSEWKCVLVDSARAGLPLSLELCAEVLDIDMQKDAKGKNLIKYFSMPCKPTKVNGGRTRNYPEHDPEKWQQFIDYCEQDVRVEMAIAKEVSSIYYPDSEQQLWTIDQLINDRGVHIDEQLMLGAYKLDEISKADLMKQAKQLTGLNNPNSTQQLLGWFQEQGLDIDNLRKATVDEYLQTATGKARKMLELRQQMSKTSVKKYDKMYNMACNDNRIRGMFQFHGAGTARWASRGVQMQNLTKHKMTDEELEIAREAIKQQDFDWLDYMLDYEYQDILSQLVRTTFTAQDGYKLAVSDFSAIEARVIAWFAGEQWRLDVFDTHGKIYEASASQMFNVPIESIGKGDPLRQKGKVAELACIAEGQRVLTDNGLKPIEQVALSDRVWDGESFVSHDGVINKGHKEVIEYDGLRATTDHMVYIKGQREPIQFGQAAASGARIAQSGNSGRALWLDRNNTPPEKVEKELAKPESVRSMHKLWSNFMGTFLQPKKWQVKRLSELLTEKASAEVVRPKNDSRQAAMHQPERLKLRKLWSKRYRVSFRFSVRGGAAHDELNQEFKQRFRDRPNRRKRALRKRKHAMGNTPTELSKPTQVYDILNAGVNHRYTVEGKLVHNCGYQGGVGALKSMGALEMGLTEEELPDIIRDWRAANPNIKKFWHNCQKAAIKAVKTGTKQTANGIKFYIKNGHLLAELPSGRALVYRDAQLNENSWGATVVEFQGLNAVRKWDKIKTYGGKLVENIVQATARDALGVSMERLEEQGYKIVAHVHDELILEVPDDGHDHLKDIEQIMSQPIDWAEGLNLDSDGFVSPFYMKD